MYLVVAADGVSTEELSGLSKMVEVVTGEQLTPLRIQQYFNEFARGVAEAGRMARITAIRGTLNDFMTQKEALHVAALFAVADGQLVRKERRVLIELSEAFGFSLGELQNTLEAARAELARALSD